MRSALARVKPPERRLRGWGWLVVLLVLLPAGCASLVARGWVKVTPPPALDLGQAGRPVVAVRYFPYGPALARELAAPYPDYDSWSARRMAADLRAMASLGVACIWLEWRPVAAQQPGFAADLQQFLDLAKAAGGMEVVLVLDGNGPEWAAGLDWLGSLGLGSAPAYRREGGLPVVYVQSTEGEPALPAVPGLALRPLTWTQPPELGRLGLPASRLERGLGVVELPLAKGPAAGQRRWQLARPEQVLDLAARWRTALALRPRCILVQSWNDFADGSFAAPNDRDGETTVKALAGAIALDRASP